MPKRMSSKRFSTTEVQGEESYVELSSMKIGERKEYIAASQQEDFSMLEYGANLLARHIKGWNWVDDEDEPLPLPSDDPAVMDDLTDIETRLLADFLMNPDTKN